MCTGSSFAQYLVDAYEARAGKLERKKVSNSKPVKVESVVETRRKFINQRESTEATWWQQFSILLRRGLKERRHEYLSWMRVTQVISTAFVIALLWCHTNPSSPLQVQDQVTYILVHTAYIYVVLCHLIVIYYWTF